jgi:microcystin-dependent protein
MPGGIAITPVVQVPIGGIAAWLKSYVNTPTLPPDWLECNGQIVNDPESVYNGQILPDLNGQNRFLRGSATSGGIGGAATVQLSIDQLPAHSHTTLASPTYQPGGAFGPQAFPAAPDTGTPYSTSTVGGNQPHENLPPCYNVVWIMRVK